MSDRFIRSRAPRSNRRPLNTRLRFEVLERDSFNCQYCGGGSGNDVLNVDHIWAHSLGGADAEWNLITSCFTCNIGKADKKVDHDRLDESSVLVLAKHRVCFEMNKRFGDVFPHSMFVKILTPGFDISQLSGCIDDSDATSLEDLFVDALVARDFADNNQMAEQDWFASNPVQGGMQ